MSMCSTSMLLDDEYAEALPLDVRQTRNERAQSDHEDEGKATAELASIMTAASNPVSPGPSSPPLVQARLQDFVPPTRPSSTPFPQPEQRNDNIECTSSPDTSIMDLDEPAADLFTAVPPPGATVGVNLSHLPAEIHECILDHLFGFRVSSTSKSSIKRWGTALRHSRRKELSGLALVSRTWRDLVQERLYRHIKLKATLQSFSESFLYFATHPHLRGYVRHIEIWFPVFQPKYGPLALGSSHSLPTVTVDGLTSATYILPSDNCSLEETFYFASETFPEVTVLTLEGGERKKAPMVNHWIRGELDPPRMMPRLNTVKTLICKGQWNLIRGFDDCHVIMSAFPNLREWHASYNKPKSKSYLSMATILARPLPLETLNICLEGDYRREGAVPPFFQKVARKLHFCQRLATAAASPTLEHFSYTGRVCKTFFNDLIAKHGDARNARLKSIDITVKNCCRSLHHWSESGSGITDMTFINAFEALVIAGIRAIAKLGTIKYLRIRYVDLDSPVPPLNPYFILQDGWCSGVWSDQILAELNRVRPAVQFEDLSETFGEVGFNKDGRMTISPEFPKSRALSLKISNYALLSGGIAIA